MTGKKGQLVIFGTGEIGSLARFYFDHDSDYQVCGFTADDDFVSADTFEGLPLIPFSKVKDCFPASEFRMFIALSYRGLNRIRSERYRRAKDRHYELASYVCSRSVFWDDLKIGDNCFVLENQTIQPTVTIGNDVMIWSGNHIGHGATIGDHTYISSHVVISGHVTIGAGCFLGVNSTIRDFATIGPETFVAMGASVTRDVPAGSVVVSARGTVYAADSLEAKKLKQRYFGING
jgi:sugar O-acyltransferase (sialic acid O-acetyltransferase NeuD family)